MNEMINDKEMFYMVVLLRRFLLLFSLCLFKVIKMTSLL